MRADRSSLRAAAAGGLVAALAVSAGFLAAGAFEDETAGPAATTATAPAPAAPTAGDVYRRSRTGIVLVDHRPPGVGPRTGPPRRDDRIATGTGFAVGDGSLIVTNEHIVAGRGTTTIQLGVDDGERIRATVAGRNARADLAVLRVDRARVPRLRPLPLGDSGAVRVGDPAYAIGNPFGLVRSLSTGVVSATGRSISSPAGGRIRGVVQTDAPINPGNSGGPLLDARGRVIGVMSQGRGNGIAFAVPVDTLKRLLADVRRRERGR